MDASSLKLTDDKWHDLWQLYHGPNGNKINILSPNTKAEIISAPISLMEDLIHDLRLLHEHFNIPSLGETSTRKNAVNCNVNRKVLFKALTELGNRWPKNKVKIKTGMQEAIAFVKEKTEEIKEAISDGVKDSEEDFGAFGQFLTA